MKLYLGTKYDRDKLGHEVVHFPLLSFEMNDINDEGMRRSFADIAEYTHLIVTSRQTVSFLQTALSMYGYFPEVLQRLQVIAIGRSTNASLQAIGVHHAIVADKEMQEGIAAILDKIDLDQAYLFYPRSSKARVFLASYLMLRGVRHQICDLYHTLPNQDALPDLMQFDEVIFTSSSTVEFFFSKIAGLPQHIKLNPCGEIVQRVLEKYLAHQFFKVTKDITVRPLNLFMGI